MSLTSIPIPSLFSAICLSPFAFLLIRYFITRIHERNYQFRPRPSLHLNIDEANARPYRPFRWKSESKAIATSPVGLDRWIELDSTYSEKIAQRKDHYAKHTRSTLASSVGSKSACHELMITAATFLATRYPSSFTFHASTGIFQNAILGTSDDTNCTDPLIFLLNHIPDDFLVLEKDTEGDGDTTYRLSAGIVCSMARWDVQKMLGKPSDVIHELSEPFTGQTLLDRNLNKMKFGTLLQGSSWSFKVGQVLFVQDDCHHHHSPLACDNSRFLLEDIHLQLDWKSLRRLPASDAIVLSVQTIFSPAEDLRGEPHIPQLLAKILREGRWPKACKEPGVVEDALLPALDCWAEEQRAFGVVPAECKEDEYPFFPGWEAAVFDEEEQ